MNRRLSILLLLLTFILATTRGHTQDSDAATGRGRPEVRIKGGEDVAVQDLPDVWRRLALQQEPQTPAEPSAAALNHVLQGKYIYTSTGAWFDFILGMTDVQSAIGEFNFDGRGRFTGIQISRTLFTSRTTFSFAGEYTVDASGAGFLFYPNQTQSIIVVNGGEAFFFVDVNSSNFREAGYARKP